MQRRDFLCSNLPQKRSEQLGTVGTASNSAGLPRLGVDRVALVSRRLEAIYRRVRKLEAERVALQGANWHLDQTFGPRRAQGPANLPDPSCDTLETINVASLAGKPLPSRLTSATKGPIAGLEYAVWCMGVTLMAAGGLAMMEQVFEAVESSEHGARIVSWLDHCWSGVTDGRETWVA